MVEKEAPRAVSAYNLVRAVMYLAASGEGLTPRQLSFSAAQDAVMAAWPYLRTPTLRLNGTTNCKDCPVVAQTKLPKRSRKRSYPREIWGRGGHFPFRRSSNKEARP